jgi:hypothetical protein
MPKHIKIGLFDTFETSRQTLVKCLQDLLEQHGLTKKILGYVKDEGENLIL